MREHIPSWLALSVPPIVIIVLIVNLIMAFVGSLVIIFSSKEKDYTKLPKKILKLFLIAVLVDLLTVILYFIPELFSSNEFIKNNFILNLESNPYKSIYSSIYVFLMMLLNIFIIYLLTRKEVDNKVYKIIMIILLFPYIYFIPSTMIMKKEYKVLDDYKHTTIENNVKIKKLLASLDIKEYMTSYTVANDTIKIYINSKDFDYQVLFEKNASILLNLIDESKKIVYSIDDKNYNYDLNTINKIFGDVKKKSINDIEKRYKDEYFEDYTYLGRINEYDVFDTSEICELEHQLLFKYKETEYYLSCTKLEKVLLINSSTSTNIKEAINKNVISYEDIIESNLDLIEKEIDN